MIIILIALLGLCVSVYAYTIERKLRNTPDYHPACNISDRISCTKPILSSYGNIFYFSNAIIGIFYYIAVIIFAALNLWNLLLILSALSCLISLWLAYILFAKIKAFCILCASVYAVNLVILSLTIAKLWLE
jgi:vitamin-K-epoxide reductase (warfarin-sensitive)